MKNQSTHLKTIKRGLVAFVFSLLAIGTSFIANAQISSTTVTVNDTSIAPSSINASPAAFCNTESTDLSVVGGELGTGAAWTWYEDACASGTSIGTGPSITVAPPNTGTTTITKTYFVRAEGGSCSNSPCVSVDVTIYPTPVTTAPANIVACYQQSVSAITLAGTPTGVIFDIAGGADVGIPDAAGVTSIAAFTASNTITDTIIRTITITPNANGCTGTPVTFTVTVLPQVDVTATSDIIACNGTTVTVPAFTTSVTGSGTMAYSWTNDMSSIGLGSSGSGDISAFTGTNISCADVVGNVAVAPSYTAAGITCPGTADNFIITIHPSPNGTIAGTTICEGETTTLTFDATCGTGPFDLELATGTAGPFTPVVGSPFNDVADGGAVTVPTPASGVTQYNLMKITDANGCERTAP